MTTLDHLLGDPGNAAVWALDPQRSELGFRCRSLWGLFPVNGRFTEFTGDGRLGGGTASGRLDVAAASLDTGIRKRDEHLRSEDFFAVERFPTISVVVTAMQLGNLGTELRSTLTVRGVSHPLPLPATVTLLDEDTVQIATRVTIDRTEWDVDGNLIGMVKAATTLTGTTVFVKTTV
jgi:polyisoprenoid-binding protein YceI